MKAQLKVTDKLTFEIESETVADVFENIAAIDEVFGEVKCGACNCQNIKFAVRQDEDENKYYELICMNKTCRARLPFGQRKKPKGSLYPKKRWNSLSEGEKERRGGKEPPYGILPKEGWFQWKPPASDSNDQTNKSQ